MTSLTFLLVLLAAVAARPAGDQQVELLHAGCFHHHEVSANSDGEWWGFYRHGETVELAPCTVRIEPCRDLGDDPDGRSGRSVVVDAGEAPMFLVRGIAHLEPRAVSIVAATSDARPRTTDGSIYLRPGDLLRLKLGAVEYRLAAAGRYDPTRPDSDGLVLGYRLMVTGPDGQSQDLKAPARFAEDGVPTLLWAGDLDRDGKLDLYMDLTDHYNVREYVLLLSSHAAAGQLVKKVASRRYVGC